MVVVIVMVVAVGTVVYEREVCWQQCEMLGDVQGGR